MEDQNRVGLLWEAAAVQREARIRETEGKKRECKKDGELEMGEIVEEGKGGKERERQRE